MNTRVGYHFLLQGIFLTQGSNPHLMSPALAGRFFTTSLRLAKIKRLQTIKYWQKYGETAGLILTAGWGSHWIWRALGVIF